MDMPEKNMMRSAKVLIGDEDDEPVTTTTTTTTPVVTKKSRTLRVIETDSATNEEPLVQLRLKSLTDFAKDSFEQIVCQASEKTMKELEVKKKERARGKDRARIDDGDLDIDEEDVIEDFSDSLIVKKKNLHPIDSSKSVEVEEEELTVVREETVRIVRLKKGQTFMHEGILFIVE